MALRGGRSLMLPFSSDVRVWLATGHTDMRKGFPGLALLVQEKLRRNPHRGDLFVFRGRRSDLVKVIWYDGQGACPFVKRLERGRFLWPFPADGAVTITPAQLAPAPGFEHVESLARSGHEISLMTKGDLVRQAIKIARFGQARWFARIEIVTRKTEAAYTAILKDAGVDLRGFTMVGDSLFDDVIPVIGPPRPRCTFPSAGGLCCGLWSGLCRVGACAFAEVSTRPAGPAPRQTTTHR